MKSTCIAVIFVLLSICVLCNTALPYAETRVEETGGNYVQTEETQQTAATEKEMDPLEVLFRTKRHIPLSLCRYCCKCWTCYFLLTPPSPKANARAAQAAGSQTNDVREGRGEGGGGRRKIPHSRISSSSPIPPVSLAANFSSPDRFQFQFSDPISGPASQAFTSKLQKPDQGGANICITSHNPLPSTSVTGSPRANAGKRLYSERRCSTSQSRQLPLQSVTRCLSHASLVWPTRPLAARRSPLRVISTTDSNRGPELLGADSASLIAVIIQSLGASRRRYPPAAASN
ncbi:hypothetical protein SKAU_G00333200 [Synaphobranchus kaupii]|uniref:Hepcidin n=1 Tax=Synaphobranchus kaupii TaxID=118154 RepID=A0A9Q1ELG4_SYNKA|nr:hypothetical protein SKAU_G00333200 [Synaphobranchus kaupii]